MRCKNCDFNVIGKFCYNCGQSVKVKRLTLKSIFKDIFKIVTNIENNLFSTLKLLIINPQSIIDSYLNGKRKAYLNPFSLFIILISIQYFVLKKVVPLLVEKLDVSISYIDDYPTLISFLSVFIYGFLFYIFFKKYNLAESLAINSFYMSVTIMLFLIATLLLWITGSQDVFLYLYLIPTILFFFYFYGRLYRSSFSLKHGKFLIVTIKLLIVFIVCQSINSKLITYFK